MEVLSLAALPESRHRHLPPDFVVNTGGNIEDFSNFNLAIRPEKLLPALEVAPRTTAFLGEGPDREAKEDRCDSEPGMKGGGSSGGGGGRTVLLRYGEASFHSSFTVHRSGKNRSRKRRRMAWIVRYVETGTRVLGGHRPVFPSDYRLIPVCGRGGPEDYRDEEAYLRAALLQKRSF
jgi:hypothetical protein